MMKYSDFDCNIGTITLVGDELGLTRLMIDCGENQPAIDNAWEYDESFFTSAQQQIKEYLSGHRKIFSLELNPTGTVFQKQCWEALQVIPYGTTQSYGDIAKTIHNPKAYRAVGLANNRNPIPLIIPCHRVIGARGQLTGYAYGIALKQQLLDLEKSL